MPPAKPQGAIPTLKMPTAHGWATGQKPTVAPGLKVNAFATGLEHPRWIQVLPNGDVLVAEATQVAGPAAQRVRLRHAGDDAARRRARRQRQPHHAAARRGRRRRRRSTARPSWKDLNQPFGMALVGDTFYVGNTDGVMAFPYVAGADSITAPGKRLTTFKPAGHWTRNLLPSPDRHEALYRRRLAHATSPTTGMEVEEGRACVYELDLATRHAAASSRGGLRNPVGLRVGADDRARSGPWSTSATASATRRRPTI